MPAVVILGYLGAFLVSTAYIPQIVKLLKEEQAEGISIPFLGILFIGSLMLLVYALWTKDPVFSLLNALAVSLSGATVVIALAVRGKNED